MDIISSKVRQNDIDVFYALLKAGLWEKEIRLSSYGTIDYGYLFQLSQEQTVIGLVAAGLGNVKNTQVPKDVKLKYAASVLQIEQRNRAMNMFIADTVRKMRMKGIYALLVKGQGVAQCYERPLWRTCGDVDFFLSEENFQKAKQYLLPLALSTEKYIYGNHLEMVIDSWVVELHGWLRGGISERINNTLDYVQKDTFNNGYVRSWDNNGVQVFMLGVENDVFYVFTHFVNHFYKGGIGLRQICDWCRLLWIYRDRIDIQNLDYKLKAAGIMSEWKAFAAFAVEYLGMPSDAMPFYSNARRWKNKSKKISSFIIDVGNFGHNRDMSYYSKYPFFVRKSISMVIRLKDLCRHALIFPIDSLKFFPYVLFTGLRAAVRGE